MLRITIQVLSMISFLVYAERSFYIATCLLYSLLTNTNVLGMFAKWTMGQFKLEFLLVDLVKTQYTRDDEEPYFCTKVDQQR